MRKATNCSGEKTANTSSGPHANTIQLSEPVNAIGSGAQPNKIRIVLNGLCGKSAWE